MKRLVVASSLALALGCSAALGQIGGNAPSGRTWGNSSAGPRLPQWETGSDMLNRWCSSVSGHFPVNNAGTWGCPALSGDATLSGAGALTLATVNGNVGSFGSA